MAPPFEANGWLSSALPPVFDDDDDDDAIVVGRVSTLPSTAVDRQSSVPRVPDT
jgi:hypothetical protein